MKPAHLCMLGHIAPVGGCCSTMPSGMMLAISKGAVVATPEATCLAQHKLAEQECFFRAAAARAPGHAQSCRPGSS